MTAVNNEWVNDLARDFNASQKDYKVVPTFKGSYDESMTAAIAAFRAKQHPNLIQIFEVGTASMMAAKGAIRPVYEIMEAAGTPVDTSKLLGSVASYYSSTDGKLIAMTVKKGDMVLFSKYAGTEIKLDGVEHLVMREEDILAIID